MSLRGICGSCSNSYWDQGLCRPFVAAAILVLLPRACFDGMNHSVSAGVGKGQDRSLLRFLCGALCCLLWREGTVEGRMHSCNGFIFLFLLACYGSPRSHWWLSEIPWVAQEYLYSRHPRSSINSWRLLPFLTSLIWIENFGGLKYWPLISGVYVWL